MPLLASLLSRPVSVALATALVSSGMAGVLPTTTLTRSSTSMVTALTRGKVIARSLLDQMMTPTTLSAGQRVTYGYGLEIAELGGHRRIGHGGSRYVVSFRAGAGRLVVARPRARFHVTGPVDADLIHVGNHAFVLADEPDVKLVFQLAADTVSSVTWTSIGRTLSLPYIP